MNQLSLLLYLGNIAGNLGPLFVIFGLVLLGGSAASFCVFFDARSTAVHRIRYEVDNLSDEFNKAWHAKKPVIGSILAVCCFLCLFCATLCPSKETVYAIVASQMGEQALKTPLATKASQALESWLDKQVVVNKKSD